MYLTLVNIDEEPHEKLISLDLPCLPRSNDEVVYSIDNVEHRWLVVKVEFRASVDFHLEQIIVYVCQ